MVYCIPIGWHVHIRVLSNVNIVNRIQHILCEVGMARTERFTNVSQVQPIPELGHYGDVTMSNQHHWDFKSATTACSYKQQRKNVKHPCYWPFVRGPSVTSGFPSQRANNVDNFVHVMTSSCVSPAVPAMQLWCGGHKRSVRQFLRKQNFRYRKSTYCIL